MKRSVKKIYCSNCRQLVKSREEENNGLVRISCPRCNKLLYVWNGVSWRKEPVSAK